MTKPEMPAQRGSLDRLVAYTDAAAAIAMTLLILPLMDGVGAAADAGLDAAGYLRTNSSPLLAFALSFAIIARFWRSHHELFGRAEREVPGLFSLNLLWLFAIVLLPVATAITGAMPSGAVEYALYIGTMLVATIAMAAMTALLRSRPDAWREGAVVGTGALVGALVAVALLLVALVVALLVPGAGYWSLLVLVLSWPVNRLVRTRWRLPADDWA